MGDLHRDDQVTLRVQLPDGSISLRLPVDPGLTPDRQRELESMYAHESLPATQVIADREGLRLVWNDGWPFQFRPPAWPEWWGNRSPAEGWDAIEAVEEFETHLYGEVVGPRLDQEITQRKISLWEALRDFPEVVKHSRQIISRVYENLISGNRIGPSRGERSREDRMKTLDGLMETVSRVEEFRRQGFTLEQAFYEVADCEKRAGKDPAKAVQSQYERGKRWQRYFSDRGKGEDPQKVSH